MTISYNSLIQIKPLESISQSAPCQVFIVGRTTPSNRYVIATHDSVTHTPWVLALLKKFAKNFCTSSLVFYYCPSKTMLIFRTNKLKMRVWSTRRVSTSGSHDPGHRRMCVRCWCMFGFAGKSCQECSKKLAKSTEWIWIEKKGRLSWRRSLTSDDAWWCVNRSAARSRRIVVYCFAIKCLVFCLLCHDSHSWRAAAVRLPQLRAKNI